MSHLFIIQSNHYKFTITFGRYDDESYVDKGGIDADQNGSGKSTRRKFNPETRL